MVKYVLKRLLWLIPVIIGVITIVFAITVIMPGDHAIVVTAAGRLRSLDEILESGR
jgi:peptide/nickel transport system permease protein